MSSTTNKKENESGKRTSWWIWGLVLGIPTAGALLVMLGLGVTALIARAKTKTPSQLRLEDIRRDARVNEMRQIMAERDHLIKQMNVNDELTNITPRLE